MAALIRAMFGRDFVVSRTFNAPDCAAGGVTAEMCGRDVAAIMYLLDFVEIACGMSQKTWAGGWSILPELDQQKMPTHAHVVGQMAIDGSGGVQSRAREDYPQGAAASQARRPRRSEEDRIDGGCNEVGRHGTLSRLFVTRRHLVSSDNIRILHFLLIIFSEYNQPWYIFICR
jgi:hypothetical protein